MSTQQDDLEAALVSPAGCSCQRGAESPTLVYALGQIGYDFGSEARRDYFTQAGVTGRDEPEKLLEHLQKNPSDSAAVGWTLNQETVPIYGIRPSGAFAAHSYDLLREFLRGQITEGVERVSIPGALGGTVTLLSGVSLPVIEPDARGMASWSTRTLVRHVLGNPPSREAELVIYNRKVSGISNFLDRIYYELRNLGVAAHERAINYAATNAFQAREVFESALKAEMNLDNIAVERSPICRPDSDCWDVRLTFFNPAKRMEQARIVYRFTVDVSDAVPVSVGKVRSWYVF